MPIGWSCFECSSMFLKVGLDVVVEEVDGVVGIKGDDEQGRNGLVKQPMVSMDVLEKWFLGVRTDQDESEKVMKIKVSRMQVILLLMVASSSSYGSGNKPINVLYAC